MKGDNESMNHPTTLHTVENILNIVFFCFFNTLWMAMLVCWLVHDFGSTIDWMAIKFGTDIHGRQRMNPTVLVIP